MRIFAGKNREELPVVAGDGSGRLVGVVGRRHLLDAYQTELMKRDVVSELGGSLDRDRHRGDPPGQGLPDERDRRARARSPAGSIRDLDVRARWGAEILLIRRRSPAADDEVEIVPEADTTVHRGDRLVVLARQRDLARLRSL